jgi:hypothetical protein
MTMISKLTVLSIATATIFSTNMVSASMPSEDDVRKQTATQTAAAQMQEDFLRTTSKIESAFATCRTLVEQENYKGLKTEVKATKKVVKQFAEQFPKNKALKGYKTELKDFKKIMKQARKAAQQELFASNFQLNASDTGVNVMHVDGVELEDAGGLGVNARSNAPNVTGNAQVNTGQGGGNLIDADQGAELRGNKQVNAGDGDNQIHAGAGSKIKGVTQINSGKGMNVVIGGKNSKIKGVKQKGRMNVEIGSAQRVINFDGDNELIVSEGGVAKNITMSSKAGGTSKVNVGRGGRMENVTVSGGGTVSTGDVPPGSSVVIKDVYQSTDMDVDAILAMLGKSKKDKKKK